MLKKNGHGCCFNSNVELKLAPGERMKRMNHRSKGSNGAFMNKTAADGPEPLEVQRPRGCRERPRRTFNGEAPPNPRDEQPFPGALPGLSRRPDSSRPLSSRPLCSARIPPLPPLLLLLPLLGVSRCSPRSCGRLEERRASNQRTTDREAREPIGPRPRGSAVMLRCWGKRGSGASVIPVTLEENDWNLLSPNA